MKLGACREDGGNEKRTGENSSSSAGRTVRQKWVARKVQLVNKLGVVVVVEWRAARRKNIMTGLNVAFTIPGDSFVPEKIDNQLTASPPEFVRALELSSRVVRGHRDA
jgi:hypothetical protein